MEDGRSELVIKYLQGQLDTQGINDFYTWVNENVENKKVFFEIKAVYDACYTNRMQNDMEGSWDRLLKKRKVFYPRKKSRWLQLGNYAAVSFITVCLTSLFLTFNKDEDKIATRYIGGDGLDADVVELPDGTQVCLGSKTVFHYENDYGRKERTVYLEGEAYFEVAKDKDKPFIVKTKEQNIEALGTKFNVTAYASDSLLTTTLLEGAVRLKTENILYQTILKPNQQFIYNRNTKFCCNLITCSNQIFCFCCNLIVDFFIHSIQVAVNAVQKADSHGNGTHIQIFLLNHFVCLINFKNIDHVNSPFLYDTIKYDALH